MDLSLSLLLTLREVIELYFTKEGKELRQSFKNGTTSEDFSDELKEIGIPEDAPDVLKNANAWFFIAVHLLFSPLVFVFMTVSKLTGKKFK